MTVTVSDLMVACLAALTARNTAGGYATVAQGRWYMPRDWPITDDEIPIGRINAPEETKEALGNSGIKFNVTGSITLVGEVSCLATPDNQSAGKVLTALALFQREIEMAIIGDETLFGGDEPGLIQQLLRVTTKSATTSDGKLQRGAVEMTFEFTFYQGENDFQQLPLTDLQRLRLYADLINVADPTGTYTPPPEFDYTPTPAPRTVGPDGRIEGEAAIELPQ